MINNEPYTDKHLFARIAEGDESAFNEVFKKHADTLFMQAFKILKSEFWAEEIVQEVFTHLWVSRSALAGITSPGPYLFRMVANKAIDRIRKQKLEVKMQYVISRQLPSDSDESNIHLDRFDELLPEAVSSLSPQGKLIYQLKYHDNQSYEEIAGKLGITRHTVRNQLAKALKSIRGFMAKKGGY